MRLQGAPGSRSLRAMLAGTTAAVVVGGAFIAAPAADAASVRPTVTAGFICVAESVGRSEGTVTCDITPGGGVAPYTVTWSETGGNIGSESQSELLVYCNTGSVVSVTATATDSTGARVQETLVRTCKTGVPIP